MQVFQNILFGVPFLDQFVAGGENKEGQNVSTNPALYIDRSTLRGNVEIAKSHGRVAGLIC